MTCKHNWHFVHGTSTLKCERCGAETGPRTPEQLAQEMMQDALTIGSAWSKGGERIDPTSVYKMYEPPKPVGAWVMDPGGVVHTNFVMYSKPTDEQIKNTEAMFGWKWKDLP